MAITTPTLASAGNYPIPRIASWAVNDYVPETGAAHEVKASPGNANAALYIEHVTMSAMDQGQLIQDVKIYLEDEDGAVYYGPIQMQVGGTPFKKDWRKYPLKLINNKALYVLGNIPGASYTFYVEGFTGYSPII